MRQIAKDWLDYECIDAGDSEKLERWGNVVLRRPDPQAAWSKDNNEKLWNKPDAFYHRSKKGGGSWEYKQQIPEYWTINYKELTLKVSPTGFKHTGLFPEQAVNWDWMMNKIRNDKRDIKVLNLFAYTGGATMACSAAGAKEVVHVDASKGMVAWAKENMELSNLQGNTIRFIVDDVLKFVQREQRRGHKYHAIVMDPPSYGRGPNGEMWKLEEQLPQLIDACMQILDDEPLFFLINAYTTGFSNIVLDNILKTTLLKKYPTGKVEAGEIGLPVRHNQLILPCGIYGKFYYED